MITFLFFRMLWIDGHILWLIHSGMDPGYDHGSRAFEHSRKLECILARLSGFFRFEIFLWDRFVLSVMYSRCSVLQLDPNNETITRNNERTWQLLESRVLCSKREFAPSGFSELCFSHESYLHCYHERNECESTGMASLFRSSSKSDCTFFA